MKKVNLDPSINYCTPHTSRRIPKREGYIDDQPLRYIHHDDWMIYAVDDDGEIYALNTETMTAWLDLLIERECLSEKRAMELPLDSDLLDPQYWGFDVADLAIFLHQENRFCRHRAAWQRVGQEAREYFVSDRFTRHVRSNRRSESRNAKHLLKTAYHKCRDFYNTARVQLVAVETIPESHSLAVNWGRISRSYNKNRPELTPVQSFTHYVTFQYEAGDTPGRHHHSSWGFRADGTVKLLAD
jgi:hypothetical protein